MCMPSVLYTLHYISVKHIAMKKPSAVFDYEHEIQAAESKSLCHHYHQSISASSLVGIYFKYTVSAHSPEYMLLHMHLPWHPVLPPQTESPWQSWVMSKRATAQSAASSLVHIYKPHPVAAH